MDRAPVDVVRFDERVVDGVVQPERLVSDPEELHRQLSEHMRDNWFGGFEEGLVGVDVTNMDTIRASEGAFKAHYNQTDIPPNIIDIIWEAIVSVPCPVDMVAELKVAAAAPSVEEWLQTVRHGKRDIAPGIDEVTYDLLRDLPETVLSGLHTLLSEMQERRMAPEEWKKHWLKVIPKVLDDTGVVNAAKLRPLFLINSARKLWMGILDKKASEIHDAYHFFSNGQRGNRKGSGTEDAILVLAAQLEEAKRLRTNLLGATWDIEKAFDSVSKKAPRLGDARSGVDVGFTDWAVGMDETGELILRTPVAEEQMAAQGYQGFSTDGKDGTKLSFCPASGAGQGDVSSPNYWKKVFDILLRAIELADAPGKLLMAEQDSLYSSEARAG